jgi:hypothetical protein
LRQFGQIFGCDGAGGGGGGFGGEVIEEVEGRSEAGEAIHSQKLIELWSEHLDNKRKQGSVPRKW